MQVNSLPEVRKQIRLPGYDYKSPGSYFVTLCTEQRLCLFGKIINGQMLHNEAGCLIHRVFKNLHNIYLGVQIDTFVVMPNHIHAIVVMGDKGWTRRSIPTGDSLSDVVKNIKTYTTACYTKGVYQKNWEPFHKRLWQKNYYEHIVRDTKSLEKIRQYIIQNPLHWDRDPENS